VFLVDELVVIAVGRWQRHGLWREIPGANGQGCTPDEARANLGGAISLILEDRREDARRGDAQERIDDYSKNFW